MIRYERANRGRFAKGNIGGPGRPRRKNEIIGIFMKQMEQLIESPERFTLKQRRLIVKLLTSFMDGSDEQAIAAASILVDMDQYTVTSMREMQAENA